MDRKTNKEAARSKGGRGNAFWKDPEKVEKIKAAFSIDANITEACQYAEISQSAYYAYKQKNLETVASWEAKSSTLYLKAKQVISDRIHAGDADWSAWLLTHRHPDYTPKQKNEVTGKDGKPLFQPLSDEQQALIAHGVAMVLPVSNERVKSNRETAKQL